jgi:hypothetical protein
MAPADFVPSWKTKPSPFEENTNGIFSVSPYSSACWSPSPALQLLSFASMTASGMFGLL